MNKNRSGDSRDPNNRKGRGGYTGGGKIARPEKRITDIWPNYLENGYFKDTEKKILREEYVSRNWVEPLVVAMANGDPALTINQLRRFFQHCRLIESKLKSKRATWQEVFSSFKFLDAAASDALGKSPPKIPEIFHDFIERNVDKVKTSDDFLKGFLPHFEALVGFGSGKLRKERN